MTGGSILITGTNRRIGFGLVTGYLQNNFRAIASCRDPDSAHELKELTQHYSATLHIEQLDVTKAIHFQDLPKKYAD